MTTLDSLVADFSAAELKVQRGTSAVLFEQSNALRDEARALCPSVTGRLEESIFATMNPDGFGAEVGPYAYYGGWVEYGNSHQAPQPFMGPALDSRAQPFVDAMAELGGSAL